MRVPGIRAAVVDGLERPEMQRGRDRWEEGIPRGGQRGAGGGSFRIVNDANAGHRVMLLDPPSASCSMGLYLWNAPPPSRF